MTMSRALRAVAAIAVGLLAACGMGPGASEIAVENDFEAQLIGFVNYRNSLLVSDGGDASRPGLLGEPAHLTLDLAETQLPSLRSLMLEMGEVYRASMSEIAVGEVTFVDSTTIEVRYTEVTAFDASGLPESPAYSADYMAVFQRDGDYWRLHSVTLATPEGIPPMTEPIEGREVSSSVEEFCEKLREADKAVVDRGFPPGEAPSSLTPPDC